MAQKIKKKFLDQDLINQVNQVESGLAQEILDREQAISVVQSEVSDLANTVQGNFDLQQSDIDGIRSDIDANSNALSQEVIDREQGDLNAIQNANSYTDQKIADLVGTAPEVLDTLGEIATALQDEQSATMAIMSQLSSLEVSVDGLETNKEDKSNKSDDELLGSSVELYPTQRAVKEYADAQDKKVVVSTFSGNNLADFMPNPQSIETQVRHYTTGVALESDKRYAAYITDTQVIFVDATNPFASKIMTSFSIPTGGSNFPQAMTSLGDFVYMTTGGGRLYCFDWSDKSNPINLGFVTIGSGQHYDVTNDGLNTVFISNTTNKRVYVVDVTNRAAGTLIKSLVLGTGSTDFGTGASYSDGYLFATNYNNKIHVMKRDVETGEWNEIYNIPTIVNPNRPLVFTNSSGSKMLFVQRYNGTSMALYDLSNPEEITELKTLTASAAIQIYNLPFMFEDIVHIGLDNGQIGGVNVFDKDNIKLAGVFEPKNANGSKKFTSMRGLVRAETNSPFFKKKTFLLATGVIGTSTQKVTTVLDLPMFDYIRSSAVTSIPSVDLSGIESDISSLQQDLASEVSRAQDAESQLQSQINNILSNTDPEALDSLTEIVEAFQNADSDLTQAINNLASNLSSEIEAESQAREAADDVLDARIDATESNVAALVDRVEVLEQKFDQPAYHRSRIVIDQELAYIDLEHEAVISSLVVSVGRIMVHEGDDFTVSVVGGVSRLTWINSLANPDGEEKIETGDVVYATYAYLA